MNARNHAAAFTLSGTSSVGLSLHGRDQRLTMLLIRTKLLEAMREQCPCCSRALVTERGLQNAFRMFLVVPASTHTSASSAVTLL